MPKNAGNAGGANAVGSSASFECGSFVRISLEIENETKLIRTGEVYHERLRIFGCGG